MTVPSSPSSGATYLDAISFASDPRRDPIRRALDDLLTRAFYSAAGYVFESDPYSVPEDAPVFEVLGGIRVDDRRHAHLLGQLVQARGGVPQPAVFPFWDLDLNYLSVPHLSGFVCGTIEREIAAYDALLAAWPAGDASGRVVLETIRADKRAHLDRLRPVSAAAIAREAATYAERIAARKKARAARLAKEKAAAEAAKKAKAAPKPAAGAPAARPAAAAAPVAAAPSAAGLDPNEPGISPKEKARRQMAKMRGGAGAAPAATPPAAAPAPVAMGADLGDPAEPGISPKEKARRTMARMRAASGVAPAAAPAPVAAAGAPAPAAAPAPVAMSADLGDPAEPGISPKEKARRTMARLRAGAGGPAGAAPAAPVGTPPAPAPVAATPEPAAAALEADVGDPDEPGISPKEKARRQVARMRAQRKG